MRMKNITSAPEQGFIPENAVSRQAAKNNR
jgi:hypothetical protein